MFFFLFLWGIMLCCYVGAFFYLKKSMWWPKKRDSMMGYRTFMAFRSEKTWTYANKKARIYMSYVHYLTILFHIGCLIFTFDSKLYLYSLWIYISGFFILIIIIDTLLVIHFKWNGEPRNTFGKLKILFFSNCAVWLIVLYLITDSSIGFNPIHIPSAISSTIFSLSPQGWGFFTRNPREDLTDIYIIQKDKSLKKVILPNASGKYLYGFKRTMRFSGAQMSTLISQIPDKKWKDFDNFHVIALDSIPIVKVKNIYKNEIFSQDNHYLITFTKRVPWAWSKYKKSEDMPVSTAVIKIKSYEKVD